MKYELIPCSNRGVLVERTPIIADIKEIFEVLFILPNEGSFVALFKDKKGVEYRESITDNKCKVPKDILKREQYIQLIVNQLIDEKIVQSWFCEPLHITAMIGLRQSQRELSGGMTDKDCFERLNEIERIHANTLAEFNALKEFVANQLQSVDAYIQKLGVQLKSVENVIDGLVRDNKNKVTAFSNAMQILGGQNG